MKDRGKYMKSRGKHRKIIIAALLCILLFTLSFTTTYAYLTDMENKTNTFIVGENQIEIEETYEPPQKLEPGISFKKEPVITNTGNIPCFVRMRADYSDSEAHEFCEPLDIDTANWEYDDTDGYYYYKKLLLPNGKTTPLFTTVKIKNTATEQQIKEFDILIYGESIGQGNYPASGYKIAWEGELIGKEDHYDD